MGVTAVQHFLPASGDSRHSRATHSGPGADTELGVTCELVPLCERSPLKTHAGVTSQNGLESPLKLLLKYCNKPKTVTLTK